MTTQNNKGMGEIMYKPKIWSMLTTDPIKPVAINICMWHDGTLRPAKGHHGRCKWVYDGQVFTHNRATKEERAE